MPVRPPLTRPVAGGLYWLGVGMALALPVQAVDKTVPAPPNENAEAPAASPVLPVLPVLPQKNPAAPNEGAVIPFLPNENPELPAPPVEGAVIPFAPQGPPALEPVPAPAPEPLPKPAAPEKPVTDLDNAWDDITHQRAYSNMGGGMGDPSGTLAGLLGNSPAGFPLGDGIGDDLLGGFKLSTTLSGTYDSNITRGQAQSGSQPQDDFFLSLNGNLSYLSKGTAWTFGGNYRGRYDEYMTRAEFSGYSQGGGVVANYKGGRFTASAIAGIDANRGSPQNFSSGTTFGGTPSGSFNQAYNQANFNRLNQSGSVTGAYKGDTFSASASVGIDMDQGSNSYASSTSSAAINSTSIHTSLALRYQVSAKTSLEGNLSQNTSSVSSGTYGGTDSFTLGTSALWKYSRLTEFGPGLRYTYTSGGRQMGRTSLGPTLSCNYQLDKRVSLTSQVGLDFNQFDNGQTSDPTMSGSLGLNYQASRLWSLNLAYSRNVQADPTSRGAFYEANSLRLGCNRKFSRATLSLGASYQTSSAIVPQGVTGGRPDSDILSLDSSLSIPVFSNKGAASVFLRYNDQTGVNTGYGSSGGSWNAFQAGFSISRNF